MCKILGSIFEIYINKYRFLSQHQVAYQILFLTNNMYESGSIKNDLTFHHSSDQCGPKNSIMNLNHVETSYFDTQIKEQICVQPNEN